MNDEISLIKTGLYSGAQIAKLTNVTKERIYYLSKKYGYKLPNQKKLNYDTDFFKKWTIESSYLLGYICADGCLKTPKNHNYSITFGLKESDIELLTNIKFFLKSNKKIGYYHQGYPSFNINSKEIYEDLLKFGLTPQKSLTLKWLNIPETYNNHFIRGYFDGDGCFFHKPESRRYVVSFLGTFDFLHNIAIRMPARYVLPKKIKHANVFTIRYYLYSEIRDIYYYLYQNSYDKIRLSRKYIKYTDFIENFIPRRSTPWLMRS